MNNPNFDPTQEYLDILLGNNFDYSDEYLNIDEWIDYLINEEKELLDKQKVQGK